MNKLRVLVADDHELIRKGIRTILNSERGAVVVGEASTGLEVLQQYEKLRPDLVIMDLMMPEIDGIEATSRIRAANSNVRVLILTMHDSEVMVRKVLNAGANGYVLKSDLASKLLVALKVVCRGRRYLSRQVSDRLVTRYLEQSHPEQQVSPQSLTSRELDVARLLSQGRSSKEIGDTLMITVRTVETHRANIMRKLNVHSVTELLHYAFTNKLIDI